MVTQCLSPRLRPDADAIANGLQKANIAGRQEMFDVCGCRLLMDVAHNEDSAIQLMQRIKHESVSGRVLMVIGMMKDKDAETFVGLMRDQVDEWLVTRALTERAMSEDELAATICKITKNQKVKTFPSALESWSDVCGSVSREDLIVVTGSFHIVAEIRQMLIESRLITA